MTEADYSAEDNLIEVRDLVKYYPLKTGFSASILGSKDFVHAVDGVSFIIKKGEIFALAGESGCGKTTTGRCILMLVKPTSGDIIYGGRNIAKLPDSEVRKLRTKLQIVFQDPYESVNPRFTIYEIVSEGLFINGLVSTDEEAMERVRTALSSVQLTPPEQFMFRYPHELSGGQRQRVSVARALVLNPDFVVADEPVSMLDVSIRAEVLNIMKDLVDKLGISFIFITHDLAVSKHIADRIAIMYLGKFAELASAEELVANPLHPYTQALMAAIPVPDPRAEKIKVLVKGEVPSAARIPSGCRFHPRCLYATEICVSQVPEFRMVSQDHWVACHYAGQVGIATQK